MFESTVLLAYLAACLLVVIVPGPDNILAISRGLSQGNKAAILSSIGAGSGILIHTLMATLGLSVIIQTSELAFWIIKIIGAFYLIYLGYKAISSRNLISFLPTAQLPLKKVFIIGTLSNVLNPKPGLFILAFVPQFVDASKGSISLQMLIYGIIFAIMTAIIFSILGCFASQLAYWLKQHSKVIKGLNISAGLTLIIAGLSILMLKPKNT